MAIALLSVAILQICLLIAVGIAVRHYVASRQRDIAATIHEWVTPLENEVSPLAKLIDGVACQLGSSMARSIMGELKANNSQIARQANAMAGDFAEAQIREDHPLIGAIADLVPSVGKRLKKNPAALIALSRALSGMSGGNHAVQSGAVASVQERINRT